MTQEPFTERLRGPKNPKQKEEKGAKNPKHTATEEK